MGYGRNATPCAVRTCLFQAHLHAKRGAVQCAPPFRTVNLALFNINYKYPYWTYITFP